MPLHHDPSSQHHDTATTPDSETTRRYDLTMTNTSLSLTINTTSILSWANTELGAYIKRDKLSTIQNLMADWEDGRAFLCLAQRFYPDLVPSTTFDTLMDQDTIDAKTRSGCAFGVFEKEFAIAPPTATPLPLYIARVRHALISLDSIAGGGQDPWTQRTHKVLHTIQHTRQQLQVLGFHSTSHPSRDDDESQKIHDPISGAAHTTSDMHDLDKYGANSNNDGRSNGWQEDLDMMEQALLNLNSVMADYHAWIDDNMDGDSPTLTEKDRRLALVQSVNDAHASLQMHLDQDQQALTVFRKRSLFTQVTAPIRQDLDWIQAAMLKTTTTDTGIKELEGRLGHAGTILQQVIEQYKNTPINNSDMDHSQQSLYPAEMDALVKRYHLVQSWVEDVRIWFVEAQRIRQWIGERIDLLENSTIPNGASTEDITMTADTVEELNTNHEAMEKEVKLFNKEDMSRLRTHVKDLTVDSTKEKDLSPADTTTIEITFATLTALDRLLHLIRKHSHRLQVLTLRVFWENEFIKAVNWVNIKAQELNIFIKTRARWQEGINNDNTLSDSKSTIIETLLEMELDISRFDQGQFTTTVNLFQEMDDASDIELPQFLESRQVGLEEQFESLVHRVSFARRVVEQYLLMVDFMDSTGGLIHRRGHDLGLKMTQQTDKVYSLFLDPSHNGGDKNALDRCLLMEKQLVDENNIFQEQAVRLITDTAGLIPHTESSSPLDYEENKTGNDRVLAAVKSRSSELILLGETLERKLDQYKQSLEWYNQLTDLHLELQYTQEQMDQDSNSLSRLVDQLEETFGDQVSQLIDGLIHSKDVTADWDKQRHQIYEKISTYQAVIEAMGNSIDGLVKFHQSSSPPTSTSTSAVSETISHVENDIKKADSRLQSLATTLDQCALKLSMAKNRQSWEYHYSQASQWITTHEQKCQQARIESTWSPTSSSLPQTQWDTMSALEQEWTIFRDQPLACLVNAFEQLVNYDGQDPSTASKGIKWVNQRQRQVNLLSQAEHTADTIVLTKALLEQHKAITEYMAGTEDIRSQGAQWLNHLKWITLHHDMEETTPSIDKSQLTLDQYNTTVENLWKQYKSSNNSGFKVSGESHDDLDLVAAWQQQCEFVEKQASDEYDALCDLGRTLQQWLSAADESSNVYGGIKIWRDKVYSLDTRVVDLEEGLMVKKDKLVERLSLGCTMTLDSGTCSNSAFYPLELDMDDFKNMDLILNQWLDQDFCALCDNGTKLNGQIEHLKESLRGLGASQDYQKTMDFVMAVNNTASHLNQLEDRCRTKVKSLLSLVLELVEAYNQQTAWESAWMDLSLITQELKGRLEDLIVDKEEWKKAGYSLAKMHDISIESAALNSKLDNALITNKRHLVELENTAYNNMELSYQNLSGHELLDPRVQISPAIHSKHIDCQQSIPHLVFSAKQLDEAVKWLETGASWLQQADGQLDKWNSVTDDLERFTQHDAKWSMDTGSYADAHNGVPSIDDSRQTLNLDAALDELGNRVTNLATTMDTTLDALNDWKSNGPSQELGPGMDGMNLWQKKVSAFETRRSHANDSLKYASDLVKLHKALQQWSDKVVDLEQQGEMVKLVLLAESGDTEADDESLQHLEIFDHKLAEIIDFGQSMDHPDRPPSMERTPSSLNNTDETNDSAALRQYIQSRHEYLEKTSLSLHSILNAKERSSRLKTLVDGYVSNAMESLQWIEQTYDNLQYEMATTEMDANQLGTIESKLVTLHDIEKSIHLHANGHYNGLKESANHCVAACELDEGAQQLNKVTALQEQVEHEWQQLSDSLQHHKASLKHAERAYWSNQVIIKCKEMDDELNNFDSLTVGNLHNSKLGQWQQDLDSIEDKDLEQLKQQFDSDDQKGLDDDIDRGLLEHATYVYQQLVSHLATVCHEVECAHRRLEYTDLAMTLITSMDNIKSTLVDWRSGPGPLSVNEAYHNGFDVFRNSVLVDYSALERLHYQEEGVFLSLDHDGAEASIEQRHQQIATGWTELQHELTVMNECYRLMTLQRPHFERLHQISLLLDNADTSLRDNGEGDEDYIYGLLKQVDRIKGMMVDSSGSFGQQSDEFSGRHTKEECDKYKVGLHDAYQQLYLVASDRLDAIKHQLDMQQKQQQVRRSCQQFQRMADEIKMSALKESSTLESLLPQENSTDEPSLNAQQYHECTKLVASSDKILHDLLHETAVLVDSMAEIADIQQTDVDNISATCQLPLDDLKYNLTQHHNLLDLMRQAVGYNQSTKDVGAWLENFCTAVEDLTANINTAYDDDGSDGSIQKLENDMNNLKLKLSGFEPTTASLETMNMAIQGISIVNDGKEHQAASTWKRSIQQLHGKVTMEWKESMEALEKTEHTMNRSLRARTLAHKIQSMKAITEVSREQIEQLQTSLTVAVPAKNSDEQNQHDPADLFKLLPREPLLTQLQHKLELLKQGLVMQGQDRRTEIDGLVDQYYNDQQWNDNSDNVTFMQQWEEVDTAWTKIMESIDGIKDTLGAQKHMAKCINMMDSADTLLESMDEVIINAAPQYKATMVDNKYSKAELEAKRIELDARCNYYKHNIEQQLQQLDETWMTISSSVDDSNKALGQVSTILDQHRLQQHKRYDKMFNQQIPARQLELEKALKQHLVHETEKMSRLRKTSLPTRKAAGTLIPVPRSAPSTGLLRPPQSTSTSLHPSSALQGRQRLRTVSSSSSLTGDSQLPRPHKSTSTSTSTKPPKSTSSTFTGRKKSATPMLSGRKPNDYVAQAGNDLDTEIGRIVNDMPYRVRVKMVPGEVGRYWFGDINPKLVYCRVLKSKMVMVRVGGGWSELSQFLRDHAKLEGELIIPRQQDQHLLHTTMQEGYLETTTSLQRQRKQLLQQHTEQSQDPQPQRPSISSTLLPAPRSTFSSSSIPIMKSSRSTSNSVVPQQGYKDSDTFIAVDRHGNPLEVKLSKFKQKSALPTSTTNRRRKATKP